MFLEGFWEDWGKSYLFEVYLKYEDCRSVFSIKEVISLFNFRGVGEIDVDSWV